MLWTRFCKEKFARKKWDININYGKHILRLGLFILVILPLLDYN
jgi:hypothetical protein